MSDAPSAPAALKLEPPTIGVVGFVLSLFGLLTLGAMALLGLLLSAIGYAQARREGRPRGLCLAGILIGVLGPLILIGNRLDRDRRDDSVTSGAGDVHGLSLSAVSFTIMRDRPPLEAAYLMAGTDRPKVQRAVARLRQRVLDEAGSDLNVVSFDAETVPVSAVLEAAQTPGLILGTRLLVVTNAHKWPAKSRQALAAYVKDPLPETCLAVEGVSFTEADQLRKAIAEHGTVLIWDLPKRYEMAGWVRERAQAHGIVMGTAAARHFLERCGMEATHGERLEREIEKLAAYCSGGEASIADIDEICTPDDEARIFSLIDAVGDRARVRAFELLEAVYLSGDEPSKILYLLLRHVDELNGALNLETNDPRAIAKRLGMPFWKARRLAAQLAQYDRRRLGHAYAVLAAAEAGLRGRAPATLETDAGINHSDRLVLELALGRLLS